MTIRKGPISRADVFKIAKIMEPVLDDDDPAPDGARRVTYKDDWSDARISTMTGVALQIVQSIRRDLFGEIKSTGGGGNLFGALVRRMEGLERRVSELEDATTRPGTDKSATEPGTLHRLINGIQKP